jgi:hypothetical protein
MYLWYLPFTASSTSPQHVSGFASKRTNVVLKVLHHNAFTYEKRRFLYTFTEYISAISDQKPTKSRLSKRFIAGKKFTIQTLNVLGTLSGFGLLFY